MTLKNRSLKVGAASILTGCSLLVAAGCTPAGNATNDRPEVASETCNQSLNRWATNSSQLPSGLVKASKSTSSSAIAPDNRPPSCVFVGESGNESFAEIYVCDSAAKCAELLALSGEAAQRDATLFLVSETNDGSKTYSVESEAGTAITAAVLMPERFLGDMGYKSGYTAFLIWQQPKE